MRKRWNFSSPQFLKNFLTLNSRKISSLPDVCLRENCCVGAEKIHLKTSLRRRSVLVTLESLFVLSLSRYTWCWSHFYFCEKMNFYSSCLLCASRLRNENFWVEIERDFREWEILKSRIYFLINIRISSVKYYIRKIKVIFKIAQNYCVFNGNCASFLLFIFFNKTAKNS